MAYREAQTSRVSLLLASPPDLLSIFFLITCAVPILFIHAPFHASIYMLAESLWQGLGRLLGTQGWSYLDLAQHDGPRFCVRAHRGRAPTGSAACDNGQHSALRKCLTSKDFEQVQGCHSHVALPHLLHLRTRRIPVEI